MGLDGTSRTRCPSCDILVDAKVSHKFMPFCSDRCRLVDLGRWLKEEHALPCDAEEDEEAEMSDTLGSEGEGVRKTPRLPPGWHDA